MLWTGLTLACYGEIPPWCTDVKGILPLLKAQYEFIVGACLKTTYRTINAN